MKKNDFAVSFKFGIDPTDTEETVDEKIGQMKTLFTTAQKMGVTLHVGCSTEPATIPKSHRVSQRECFNELKAQNADAVADLTSWSPIVGLSTSMVRRVFTGHIPISAAVLKTIETAVSEGHIRCDDETLRALRDLANA